MEIRGKAPLRISFAGGGTDLSYVYERYGGAVVSCTIDKYCHMSIWKRDDPKIFVNGELLNGDESLIQKIVEYFQPRFGFELTYYNDLSPGSGLGGSSSFTVLLLRLLHELNGDRPTDFELVKLAYVIETSMKEGGWQDQYATAIGGFNFMEFSTTPLIYPLRLKYSFLCELNEHLLLVSIEGKKEKNIHKKLREFSEKNSQELLRTADIRNLAFKVRDSFLNERILDLGKILHENWVLKRNKFTSTPGINEMYNVALKNGAEGGKLCSEGQTGHFLFFVKPENRTKLINTLKLPVVNFNLVNRGVETW